MGEWAGGARLRALLAAVLSIAASVGLVVSAGSAEISRYVSTTGTVGGPSVGLYRLSVFAVALSAALLGWALYRSCRPAALALVAAAPAVLVSGAVSCTAGCPLPPYESTTLADLLHAAASAAGVAGCALAMLLLAVRSTDPAIRVTSRLAIAVAAPGIAGIAVAMLALGQGPLAGLLERVVLVACLCWLVAVALLLTRHPARPRHRPESGPRSRPGPLTGHAEGSAGGRPVAGGGDHRSELGDRPGGGGGTGPPR